MKNTLKSNFEILNIKDNFILLQDLLYNSKDSYTSVTNDAKNVVKFIVEKYNAENKQIFYIDTDGRVDELLHDGSKFIGFRFGYNNIDEFVKVYGS